MDRRKAQPGDCGHPVLLFIQPFQKPMKITLKLLATYRQYLPPGVQGDSLDLQVEENVQIREVLKKFSVPADGTSVILVNGRTPPADETLQEDDVLCVFPIGTGG